MYIKFSYIVKYKSCVISIFVCEQFYTQINKLHTIPNIILIEYLIRYL